MESLEHLKSRFKTEYPYEAQHPLGLRIRRVLSWYERGLAETDDPDARFVFCWIAFNAAYGIDDGERILRGDGPVHDLVRQREFFEKLLSLDRHRRLHALLRNEVYEAVHTLLDNEYIYRAFWRYEMGEDRFSEWEDTLEEQHIVVGRAYRDGDTFTILKTLFERLYVLRNQLIHGGATYQGRVNRDQVEDGAQILSSLIPAMADIMMDGPDTDWGLATFPVISPN